jgi:hypothetical protein
MTDAVNRRPLKTRQRAWAHALARFFLRCGVTPNQMSVASIGWATLCGAAYLLSARNPSPLWAGVDLIAAAVFIQLRLLANMLDGLMAVDERGGKAPAGVLYNEMPDRAADAIILVAAGYACGWAWLGWLSALLATATAYVRALGGSLGYPEDFSGPMAKPHRMFAMTVGTAAAAFLPAWPVLAIALAVVAAGAAVTVASRTWRLARRLREARHA